MESYIKSLFGSTKTHYNEMAENRQSMTAKSSRDIAERRKEEIYHESVKKAINAIKQEIIRERQRGKFEAFVVPLVHEFSIDLTHVEEIKNHFEDLGYKFYIESGAFFSIIVKW